MGLAYLYNFDHDGTTLKAEHMRWVNGPAAQRMRKTRELRVQVTGLASRVGRDAPNERLSLQRAQRVVDFFVRAGVPQSRIAVNAWGERYAFGLSEDDDFDRGVLVALRSGYVAPPPPPPPRRLPSPSLPRPTQATHFRMRMTFAADASHGPVAGMYANFEIEDEHGNRQGYRFIGTGLSIGLPASVTFTGPWNAFTTRRPHTVRDFAGEAEINGLTDGKHLNWTLVALRPVAAHGVVFWSFQTGTSVSFGLSVMRGRFFIFP
ncbi:OmpA family protein [Schlegelella sp. S2-27]|uniref:OmpA family protein n=1 Tax=Caldimonas mangrovi TaxID=2944811 RepID=A0ABT0YNY5_9BURK|nr:OmpA family protein [Caldimonas mangrovi]MCM5680442.1 OmpA family protein [Caldimonas mangrovi]